MSTTTTITGVTKAKLMTELQKEVVFDLIDIGYTYYDAMHGDIILSRPSDAHECPKRVVIDNIGLVKDYMGKD